MARVRVSGATAQKIRKAAEDKVARDMIRRGLRVESAAKKRISINPKRVDTGRLRSSIKTVAIRRLGVPGARIGSNVEYALFVHDGTGRFGPKKRDIRPKTKRFLRFKPRDSDTYVFAKKVKGMKPNPYLKDALPAARG